MIKFGIKFEPRDVWIGLYWNRNKEGGLSFYICLIPCLPVIVKTCCNTESGEDLEPNEIW